MLRLASQKVLLRDGDKVLGTHTPSLRGLQSERVTHHRRPTASETAMTTTSTLSGRDRAILPAVPAGGGELQLGAPTSCSARRSGATCHGDAFAHQDESLAGALW